VRPTRRNYNFPEPDLLTTLVTTYFTYIAPMLAFLHRPTFMKALDEGMHLQDDKFGALVLLVCATASRYSDDPRTLLEGGHLHSAGWKWFSQVEPFASGILSCPELYDLQVAVVSIIHHFQSLHGRFDKPMPQLSVIYVHGMLPPHESWIMVGVGLRLAQDLGAHCRQPHHTPPTVEDELLKRAFWYAQSLH
jgi:Fungal specific transcription factor domain